MRWKASALMVFLFGDGKWNSRPYSRTSVLSTGDSSGHHLLSYHLLTFDTQDIITVNEIKVGGKRTMMYHSVKRISYRVHIDIWGPRRPRW